MVREEFNERIFSRGRGEKKVMLITDEKALPKFQKSKRIWQGIPSIEVTAGGRIFLTYYSGGIKEEIGNYVVLAMSEDGVNFSDPIAVVYEEGQRCFDPCLWIDPLGRLWLTWARCPESGTFAVICEDPDAEKLVFGEEFRIGNDIMMNKPTVTSAGEWLFPVAVWNDKLRNMLSEWFPKDSAGEFAEKAGSYVYRTLDHGRTFQKQGAADIQGRSFDEHMLLEKEDGTLRLFARTDYGIGAADSHDGGSSFGESFDTGYGGPCSRFHIRRLKSGRILLLNHWDYTGRNNLTAFLSEDDGETFPYKLLLDGRDNVSYPDVKEAEDGFIYIVYDRERGGFQKTFADAMACAREILIAKVTEEDILRGSLPGGKEQQGENADEILDSGGYLRRIASKLTVYDGADQNLFEEGRNYITIDGGTTNTRVCLVKDKSIVGSVKMPFGFGGQQSDFYGQKQEIRICMEKLLAENGMKMENITAVLASGMITSEFGLCKVDHLAAPAGILKLHEGMRRELFEDICPVPFYFIPGVKVMGDSLEDTDMMRGEETEIIGLTEAYGAEYAYVLPGSHSKLLLLNDKREIISVRTMMTGEMIAAFSQHTILRGAVELKQEGYDAEHLILGYECGVKLGVNEAVFKTRILKNIYHKSSDAVYSYFLGVILAGEIENIRKCGKSGVVIGGRSQLKNAIGEILRQKTRLQVICVPDEKVEESVALGAVAVYESK